MWSAFSDCRWDCKKHTLIINDVMNQGFDDINSDEFSPPRTKKETQRRLGSLESKWHTVIWVGTMIFCLRCQSSLLITWRSRKQQKDMGLPHNHDKRHLFHSFFSHFFFFLARKDGHRYVFRLFRYQSSIGTKVVSSSDPWHSCNYALFFFLACRILTRHFQKRIGHIRS